MKSSPKQKMDIGKTNYFSNINRTKRKVRENDMDQF